METLFKYVIPAINDINELFFQSTYGETVTEKDTEMPIPRITIILKETNTRTQNFNGQNTIVKMPEIYLSFLN